MYYFYIGVNQDHQIRIINLHRLRIFMIIMSMKAMMHSNRLVIYVY
jgi:hypothetical protein